MYELWWNKSVGHTEYREWKNCFAESGGTQKSMIVEEQGGFSKRKVV